MNVVTFENCVRLRSCRSLWRTFPKWLDFSFQLPILVIDLRDPTFLGMQEFLLNSMSFLMNVGKKDYD
jgi:hypothetical protein